MLLTDWIIQLNFQDKKLFQKVWQGTQAIHDGPDLNNGYRIGSPGKLNIKDEFSIWEIPITKYYDWFCKEQLTKAAKFFKTTPENAVFYLWGVGE